MTPLTIILLVPAIVIGAVIFRAWVLTVLWSWFLVPLGAIEINITSAIGISLVVSVFTHHLQTETNFKGEKRDAGEVFSKLIGASFGAPLVMLFTGWIVTWFM